MTTSLQVLQTVLAAFKVNVSSSDSCAAEGVRCSTSSGRVVVQEINLNNVQVGGFIATEVGLLTSLTVLRNFRSQLTGTLPSQLGRLTLLRSLSLDVNRLSGTIPFELGNLSLLLRLHLGYNNNLTGRVPLLLERRTTPFEILQLTKTRLSGDAANWTATSLCELLETACFVNCRVNCSCEMTDCNLPTLASPTTSTMLSATMTATTSVSASTSMSMSMATTGSLTTVATVAIDLTATTAESSDVAAVVAGSVCAAVFVIVVVLLVVYFMRGGFRRRDGSAVVEAEKPAVAPEPPIYNSISLSLAQANQNQYEVGNL
jgi:hypothetical protein